VVAKTETERYMAWPGQALGYKVGSLKIQQLRARAESAGRQVQPAGLPRGGAGRRHRRWPCWKKVDRWIAAQK
jgi:hypothetical protein